MTALETFATASKQPLTTGRQWYGPRPPGAGYDRPSTASRENCHADRSHWFGPGEICLRDLRRRRSWQDGACARRFAVMPYQRFSQTCRRALSAWKPRTAHTFGRRRFLDLGHDVRLISPQFVTPYVKSNKNDRNDAEAICEAVGRPNMRFVPVKSAEQLAVQAVHRIRSRLVADRVRLVNQVRGLLGEHGIVVAKDIGNLRRALARISATMRTALSIPWFAR